MRRSAWIGAMLVGLMSLSSAGAESAPYEGPVLDFHLHAWTDDSGGWGLCLPWSQQFPVWDQRTDWAEIFVAVHEDPPCDDPIWAPSKTGETVLDVTLREMQRHRVVGVLSGEHDEVLRWRDAAPDRFLPALGFRMPEEGADLEELRRQLTGARFVVLGEISTQYGGIGPDDERMAPVWALAEELDVAVAVHMEAGVPGVAMLPFGVENYRSRLGRPLLLEEVLNRHPRLRIAVMHYGSPFIDEMIAVLSAYPQVHVDIGGMQWYWPQKTFHRHLEMMVDAGFANRIMYGSDQAEWPGVIAPAIQIINEAPFLSTEEKAAILYGNAARFLRLSDEQMARHQELVRSP